MRNCIASAFERQAKLWRPRERLGASMASRSSQTVIDPVGRFRRLAGITAAFVLLGCAAAALGAWTFRALLFDNNLHVVVPGEVYRSAQPSPVEIPRLVARLGLKSIVNLRGGYDDWEWFRRERAAAEQCGVKLYSVHLRADRLPGAPQLRELIDILSDCPRPVLIHCYGGIDRSGLASALVHLLGGASLEESRREYRLQHGYVKPFARSDLPEVLDLYEHWLHVQQQPSSARRLRDWADTVYIPYCYRAEIDAVRLPEQVASDQSTRVRFRVTNQSSDDWLLSSKRDWGFHLGIKIRAADSTRSYSTEVRGEYRERLVAPGEAVMIDAELPPFPTPGEYRLVVDMVDENVVWFADMGSPPLKADVIVTPLAQAKTPTRLK